jgi:Fe-S oxidoreductase
MASSEDEFEMAMMSVFEELPEDVEILNALEDISDDDFGQTTMVHIKETPFSNTLTYKFQLDSKMIHIDVKKSNRLNFEESVKTRAGGDDAIVFVDEKSFAVSKIEDLRWTDMLDLYSCTGCGRCQELCPAYINDQPLSPKALILNMRDRLLEKASFEYEHPDQVFEPETPLIGDIVPTETLWSCTTCNACVDACPVYIGHIDKIVDMRRHLAMVEADFPNNVDTVFNNIETNSNPWGIGKADRDKWADELNIKRMKDHPDTDLLFWVGCAGSFDERAKTVSTSIVKILRAANVDFAILGKEENCTGDPARRMGNEYLAMQLMTQNVDLLNSYNFKEVITFCPHCFNNLANELPDF